MASSTTAARVLAVTELLEAIIVELPMRQIFAVQMVCVQWRNVVRESRAIQTKVFNHVDPSTITQDTLATSTINPLGVTAVTEAVSIWNGNGRADWADTVCSWRKTQLFMPACTHVEFAVERSDYRYCRGQLDNVKGTTLGELIDGVRDTIRAHTLRGGRIDVVVFHKNTRRFPLNLDVSLDSDFDDY